MLDSSQSLDPSRYCHLYVKSWQPAMPYSADVRNTTPSFDWITEFAQLAIACSSRHFFPMPGAGCNPIQWQSQTLREWENSDNISLESFNNCPLYKLVSLNQSSFGMNYECPGSAVFGVKRWGCKELLCPGSYSCTTPPEDLSILELVPRG